MRTGRSNLTLKSSSALQFRFLALTRMHINSHDMVCLLPAASLSEKNMAET
jgi:hypothetical protein